MFAAWKRQTFGKKNVNRTIVVLPLEGDTPVIAWLTGIHGKQDTDDDLIEMLRWLSCTCR